MCQLILPVRERDGACVVNKATRTSADAMWLIIGDGLPRPIIEGKVPMTDGVSLSYPVTFGGIGRVEVSVDGSIRTVLGAVTIAVYVGAVNLWDEFAFGGTLSEPLPAVWLVNVLGEK